MQDLTLSQFWDLFKDHILPNIGTVILNVVLFCAVGFICFIVICILGYRKKWFRRHHRFYNFATRIFYVYWMVILFWFSIQLGAIRGGYKVIENETPVITREIYAQSVKQAFASETEKQEFVSGLQVSAKAAMATSQAFTDEMVKSIKSRSTGYGLTDKAKDKGTDLVMDLFGDDINKSILYGAMRAGGHQVGVGEEITYPQFSSAMDVLLKADAQTIEAGMLEEINITLTSFFHGYYMQLMTSSVLIFLLLFCIPFIELLLYRLWLRRKRNKGVDPFAPKVVEVEREF